MNFFSSVARSEFSVKKTCMYLDKNINNVQFDFQKVNNTRLEEIENIYLSYGVRLFAGGQQLFYGRQPQFSSVHTEVP